MLLSSVLVSIISGGFGYLLAQWQPAWFNVQASRSLLSPLWIVVLLLAGGMRAVLVVYGSEAMLGMTGIIVGFIVGVWLARREAKTLR